MSPSTNSRTEVANTSYSAANFASIFAVLNTFSAAIRVPDIQEPEDLDTVIRCTDDTKALRELALTLLATAVDRKAKTLLTEDQWPKLCSSLAAGSAVHLLKGLEVPEDAAESLDDFVAQPPAVRVDVLYWFCEIALMNNTVIKALIDGECERERKPASASTNTAVNDALVRLTPLVEIAKQRYWLFGNNTRQLYLESLSQKGKGRLELLAQSLEEFAAVAADLRAQRSHAQKELADRLDTEVVPFLEKQVRKRERVERALQRQAIAAANVHLYETRTRKRQRVNYNVDEDISYNF
ncbi:hypothetical protein GGF37_002884 [Kickxella alabastrina]|nr:hypothetical protein GGF37_002884 [Kickxella alabastrina]